MSQVNSVTGSHSATVPKNDCPTLWSDYRARNNHIPGLFYTRFIFLGKCLNKGKLGLRCNEYALRINFDTIEEFI